MSTVEKTIIGYKGATFKDLFSRDGRERMRYRSAVKDLNRLIVPHMPNIVAAGEEWNPVISLKSYYEGSGPASVQFNVRNHDGAIEMRLEHRSEMYVNYSGGYFELYHRTTVISVRNGVIESIETGKEMRNDYRIGTETYIQKGTKKWHEFRPTMHAAETLPEKTSALRSTVNSLTDVANNKRIWFVH